MALIDYRPPLSPYLRILYQDEDLLVLDKPSGLLSVPGKATEHRDSLQWRAQLVFPTATVVHRLDMATSGIMLMALNAHSHRHLSRQFETRQTKKRYQARIWGTPEQEQGEVNLPLICDWPNRPKQMVDHERGKPALTHWRSIAQNDAESLVELVPVTGRSHQLRVHMLSLGHPILGDRLYAHERALTMAPRLQLHACYLGITHPTSGIWMDFHSPAPFSLGDAGLPDSGASLED
ncbi:bifunctional tRNA pseudouridine(32) synthase/23S rRNA pseudouridine(746) synthase RluA [Aliiglaciecola sp. CAU 1673]|uniref:bifunctional tRNA pseudouridine(32) synthase/23S rRNA pseudouridine(746) synthase RluA n=1 Tax=Aliiglaciecola sp. CAU 1673 TaxID=3032595 RepID=UPI0023DBDBFA|nr:bifunctional tRNA pseudouridine(32) synthase/23S rRNA pseudouridine(746) synthase RluA [Aliiglaciecola sp. CAU 1673]MDF2179004.1 bifunctional tRNA pseudouridine(32) synthase/23S rRNA pseudouridine(746) synthase RluA [Aliiglaciecola sp. CAU 1673]